MIYRFRPPDVGFRPISSITPTVFLQSLIVRYMAIFFQNLLPITRYIFGISAPKSMSLNFLVIFRQHFQKQNSSIHSPYENFGSFSTIFEIEWKTFSWRFRPPDATSIIPTVLLESSIEIRQFLWFFKKLELQTELHILKFCPEAVTRYISRISASKSISLNFLEIFRQLFQKQNLSLWKFR